VRESVEAIEICQDEAIYVYSTSYTKEYLIEDGAWTSDGIEHDSRLCLWDAFGPITVTKEFYDLFTSLLVEDISYNTAYDIGYNMGLNDFSEEGIEALGVLCDWQVMTDQSSFPIVTIINYHPMYYLHCDIDYDGETVPFVVPPADSAEGAVASYSWADYGVPFSDVKQIDIQNVRWSANE
jgi:hypothetical protein